MHEPSLELLDQLYGGERVYPIYYVKARWSQNVTEKDTDPCPWQIEGLPEGRLRNSVSWYRMPKECGEDDESWLARETKMEWWPEWQAQDKYKDLNLDDLEVTVIFQRFETWCLGWFNHWTYDLGFDDAKVLACFSDYVMRTEITNQREGEVKNDHWQEPYCLMGAEDRYRWSGTADGDPSNRTDPPCRCSHCKKHGIVRIGH